MRAPNCIFARIRRGKRQEPNGPASPRPGWRLVTPRPGPIPGGGGGGMQGSGFCVCWMLFRCLGTRGLYRYGDSLAVFFFVLQR